MLKLVIVVLLIAVFASLTTGFYFLVKDQGDSKKRLYYALGIRISLAALLMATVIYGIGTGQLGSQAPWDQQLHPERTAPTQTQ